MATVSIPPSPERYSSRAQSRDPQPHRCRAAQGLERRLLGQGRNRFGRVSRELPRHRPEARCMAGRERARKPCRVLSARASPLPPAHFQFHGARRPAGTRAPHEQGPGLSERRRARTSRQRRARRDRRQMGCRRQGLYQMGMPGCVITPSLKVQTRGCSITFTPDPLRPRRRGLRAAARPNVDPLGLRRLVERGQKAPARRTRPARPGRLAAERHRGAPALPCWAWPHRRACFCPRGHGELPAGPRPEPRPPPRAGRL